MVHCTVINGSVTTDGHNHRILLRLPWNVESHKHMSLRMDFSLGVDYYNCSASRFPLIVLPRRRNIGINLAEWSEISSVGNYLTVEDSGILGSEMGETLFISKLRSNWFLDKALYHIASSGTLVAIP